MTAEELARFVGEFESRTLPKARWTHEAHLLTALWYLTRHTEDEALDILRARIRAYNEAVGGRNSDTEGYHETLTRLYLRGVREFVQARVAEPLEALAAALLASPMADRAWPFQFYSRERLFSVAARRDWLEPDLRDAGTARRTG